MGTCVTQHHPSQPFSLWPPSFTASPSGPVTPCLTLCFLRPLWTLLETHSVSWVFGQETAQHIPYPPGDDGHLDCCQIWPVAVGRRGAHPTYRVFRMPPTLGMCTSLCWITENTRFAKGLGSLPPISMSWSTVPSRKQLCGCQSNPWSVIRQTCKLVHFVAVTASARPVSPSFPCRPAAWVLPLSSGCRRKRGAADRVFYLPAGSSPALLWPPTVAPASCWHLRKRRPPTSPLWTRALRP